MANIFNKKHDQDPLDEEVISQNGQETPEHNPSSEESEKLNAVRELLFGQNVKEYRDEFDELKKLIQNQKEDFDRESSDMKTDIIDRLDRMDEKFNTKIDDSVKSINEKLDQLSNDKADRRKMASLLHNLASQLED